MQEVVYKKIYLKDACCQTEPPALKSDFLNPKVVQIAKKAFVILGALALICGVVASAGTALGYMAISPWLSETLIMNGSIAVLSHFFASKATMSPFSFKLGMFGLPGCSISFGTSTFNLQN